MPDFATLLTTWDSLRKWVSDFSASRDRRTQSHTDALLAIYMAATETKGYLTELHRKAHRSREKEVSLSKLWVEAGIRLRKIQPDLADRCITKAEYWTDPESWSAKQIEQARIGLKQMFDEARALLFR